MALVHGREDLGRHERRIAELDLVCDSLCTRIVERERELEQARLELERVRAEGPSGSGALAELEQELNDLRRAARGQATRIRLEALRDAAELSRRITELTRRPAESRERLLGSINEAIARIGGEPDALRGAPGDPADLSPSALDDGARRSPNAEVPEMPDGLFDGLVEVEVGPLADFSQLVGFEDAAGAIAATSQISVKRFARGRATLEVRLAEPVELLRELEQRSPLEFRVRDQRRGRLVLDVDDE